MVRGAVSSQWGQVTSMPDQGLGLTQQDQGTQQWVFLLFSYSPYRKALLECELRRLGPASASLGMTLSPGVEKCLALTAKSV